MMTRAALALVTALVLFPAMLTPPDTTIRLATTTSTEDTGLLDRLTPPFEKMFGVKVHVIAVGTGQALNLGRNGDVDVVLVHAPEAESQFMDEGEGVNRRAVMSNDFVVVGPAADPAQVAKAGGPADVLSRIAKANAPFVSRGDDSGTHKKEKALWKAAGVEPKGAWYLEAGQGMSPTLLMADEKQAYCLADRGTYLALKDKLRLIVLFQNHKDLMNPYSVIAVNPARHPRTNYFGAMLLIAWMTSPEGQDIIGEFKVGGEVLFHPTAIPDAGKKPKAANTK